MGIRGFCVSWWLFREHHTADLPPDVTILSVTIASESHTFVNWNLKKKKKSTFKLMHPFPELHKEGIK